MDLNILYVYLLWIWQDFQASIKLTVDEVDYTKTNFKMINISLTLSISLSELEGLKGMITIFPQILHFQYIY